MKGLARTVSMLVFATHIICAVTATDTERTRPIGKTFHVKSDATELVVNVRGRDAAKPLLLYLHGGPGDANGPLVFQAYAGPELEKHFVVAYLHQRHTCLSPAAPPDTLTLGHWVADVDHTVRFLKGKFGKRKVLLVGHSFGGALGLLYLLEHPGNIEKFVCAGGAFSTAAIENNGYRTVLAMAEKAGDQDAVKRLTSVGPPPYRTFMEGLVWRMVGMRLLAESGEGIDRHLDLSRVVAITGVEKIDPAWMNRSLVIAQTMWKELGTVNLEDRVRDIDVPMLLITGAKDIMVPFRILKRGYENYGGPKDHIALEHSNHMMFVDEPERFVSAVIEFLQK